jgi:hypothetical protein
MAEFDIFNLGTDDVETHQKRQTNLTELYRPKAKDGQDGVYKAKIRFVPNPKNPQKSLIHKYVYWLEDASGNGRLIDSPQSVGESCPIADTFWKLKKSESAVDQKASENLKRRQKYYALIKILKDPQRPDLEDQYMIFNFGPKIKEKIDEEINPTFDDHEPTQVFDLFEGKDFELKITRQGDYNNYDKCQFSPTKTPITIQGRHAERSAHDREIIQKELEQAPDLEQFEYKEWNEDTKNFVNNVLSLYVSTSNSTQNMAAATSFNSTAPSSSEKENPEKEAVDTIEGSGPAQSDTTDNADLLDNKEETTDENNNGSDDDDDDPLDTWLEEKGI